MQKEFAFMHGGRRFHCFQQGGERWVCDAGGVVFDVGAAAELADRAAIEAAAIKAFETAARPG